MLRTSLTPILVICDRAYAIVLNGLSAVLPREGSPSSTPFVDTNHVSNLALIVAIPIWAGSFHTTCPAALVLNICWVLTPTTPVESYREVI